MKALVNRRLLSEGEGRKQTEERKKEVERRLKQMILDKAEELGVDIEFAVNPDESLKKVVDAKIVFGYVTPEMLKVAKRLEWVQSGGAGMEHFIFPELAESKIIVTNAAGIYNEEIADHVFAFITCWAREFPKLIRSQDQEIWEDWSRNVKVVLLFGKTLGVVGLGGIGREVAKRAHAFGMNVVATRAHPERGGPPFVKKVWGPEGLKYLLRDSDFIVICTPYTPKTVHLISAKELKEMKRTAFLVSIGRGINVDLEALTEALKRKEIAGAGLDVFEQEPLPKGHPLWKMKNVIITPHCAACDGGDGWPIYDERRVKLFLKNLENFVHGRNLINVVDKKEWH